MDPSGSTGATIAHRKPWRAIAAVLVTLGCSSTEPRDFLDARFAPEEPVVRAGAVSGGRVWIANHGSEAVEVENTCPPRVLLFDRRGGQRSPA